MNKKAFTLIELLAIIVILAVIAVITTPLILGIIDDAKKNTITDSAHGYKEGIYNYNAYQQSKDSNLELKGSYTTQELKTAGFEVAGKEPDSGIVLIDDKGITGCLQYDEYASYLYDNKVTKTFKGNCPKEKIVTEGSGLYKSNIEERLIYRGENTEVKNYIILKENNTNVTYRIVSYELDGTIKVVREDRINRQDGTTGGLAWDETNARNKNDNTYCSSPTNGCNVWGNSSNTLYNNQQISNNFKYTYYETASSTTLINGTQGTVVSDSTLNQYLNNAWLESTGLSKYIENHNFNVGGIYYYKEYEGGDKTIIKEKEEEKLFTWKGKVGLLNATEFVESSTNPECSSVYSAYKFNYNKYYYQGEGESGKTEHAPTANTYPCKIDNWTHKSAYPDWTLSAYSNFPTSVWYIHYNGYFTSTSANVVSSYSVRPAFYLKSDIILTGEGTSQQPYQIVEM